LKNRLLPKIAAGILLTIIFALLNGYIYLNKNEGYVYYLSNYNSIYYPTEYVSINGIENVNTDTIAIVLSTDRDEQKWHITINDTSDYDVIGSHPRIYLPWTGNNYISNVKICDGENQFCFDIQLQRQDLGDIHIVNSSIPFTGISGYGFYDFCNIDWVNGTEKEKLSSILKNELLIDTCESSLSKVRLITSHVNNISRRIKNLPLKYTWNLYTACEIYEKTAAGETRMTCNEYSEVYYLLANLAGIPTRRVGVVGFANSDGVTKFSGHHFNESYIPEQGKWAFVDITASKAYVINTSQFVLNTFELFMANISDNFEGLETADLQGDSVVLNPYSATNSNEQYYFNKDCIIQYKFGNDRFSLLNQFERYAFKPEPVLSLNYSNERLFLKIFCILMLLGSSVFTAIFLIKLVVLRTDGHDT